MRNPTLFTTLLFTAMTCALQTSFALEANSGFSAPPALADPQTSPSLSLSGAAPLKYLAPNPDTPGQIFAASDHELFRRESDLPWKNFASVETGSDRIRQFLPQTPQSLFITTERAVFELHLDQNKLEKVFEHRTDFGSSIFSFGVWDLPNRVWVAGTADGLFLSTDQGKTWSPSTLLPGQLPVTLAAAIDKKMFFVSNRTLYKAETPNLARPVLILPDSPASAEETENANDAPGEEFSAEEPFKPQLIPAGKDLRHLWLSTENGVAESRDGGEHWQMMSLSGLGNAQVRALAYAEQKNLLFAGTGSGIYVYLPQANRWRIFSRSPQENTGALAVAAGKEEKLMALTEGRVLEYLIQPEHGFSSQLWLASPEKEKRFETLKFFEPTVREMHRAVIRFGNLSSEKISRWQRESRLRALLPSFSVGRDFSDHNTIDLDRGGTADPDRYILGPESHSRGADMNLSWSLGDLIWDTAQTSIDTREKLMIDQRRDFLAEATRIYYERRRLQAELLYSDPQEQEISPLYEKQIRLEELTAQLDALTGGWYSERLERIYDQHPELKSIGHNVTKS